MLACRETRQGLRSGFGLARVRLANGLLPLAVSIDVRIDGGQQLRLRGDLPVSLLEEHSKVRVGRCEEKHRYGSEGGDEEGHTPPEWPRGSPKSTARTRNLSKTTCPQGLQVFGEGLAKVRLFARKESCSSRHSGCMRCPIVRGATWPSGALGLQTASARCQVRGRIDRADRRAV
jgi:hypothetical protein